MRNKNLRNKLTLVILGRSGSGKGTQARFIISRLGKRYAKHLSTGYFLRELLKKPGLTVRILQKAMSRGELAPAWLAAHLWLRELVENGHADKHLVFDGAPRRIWEAGLIDEVMRWHKRVLPVCLYIDVSYQEGMRRLLLRGRKDDRAAAIRNRMKFFVKDVLPVIDFYRRRGRLVRVDGNSAVEIVRRNIDKALAKKFGSKW